MEKGIDNSSTITGTNLVWWHMLRRERFLIASTSLAVTLLNISPINAAIGKFILGYICLFSLANPLSALIALSASQVVADPVGVPLTLAQSLFVCWPIHMLTCRAHVDYRPLRVFALWTFPAVLAFKILNAAKWGTWAAITPFELAVAVGLSGAWYVGRLRKRWILGLTCLGLGALPSVLSYWLYSIGIPMEGLVAAKSIGIEAGVGTGRSDGNLAGVSIAIASTIIAAVSLSYLATDGLSSSKRWSRGIGASIIALSIPAVLSTMSRGGVLYFGLGIGTALLIGRKHVSNVVTACGAVLILVLLSYWSVGGSSSRTYLHSMIEYSGRQFDQSVFLSRDGVWRGAIEEILASPIVGTSPSVQNALGGYEYCSHNVWLDFGREAGIPGIIWFTFFFIFPLHRLIIARGIYTAMPFAALFAVFFGVFMCLSLGNYKTFYILWSLTFAAASAPFLPSIPSNKKIQFPRLAS